MTPIRLRDKFDAASTWFRRASEGARASVFALLVGLGVILAVPVLALVDNCDVNPTQSHCLDSENSSDDVSSPSPSGLTAIAAIGCSNTDLAVAGYLDQSELDRLVNTAAGGETVERWANTTDNWEEHYLPNRPEDGFDAAWLNLCERAREGLSRANVVQQLERIWELDPGIPVYISPLNFYAGEECRVTAGNQVSDNGAALADALVEEFDDIYRGPDLGPLGAGDLREDLCHPNQDGVAVLGAQLVDFFDSTN